jgi:hypothetical protein
MRTRWTAEKRKRFLDVLAQTGNVALASRAIGNASTSSVRCLRRADPGFAAEWDQAIAEALARLEAALVARALAAVEAHSSALEAEAPFDFDQTLKLLKYYQAGPSARRPTGPARRYATREETDAALMKKLDVVEAQIRARERKEAAARRAARAAAKGAAVKGQG